MQGANRKSDNISEACLGKKSQRALSVPVSNKNLCYTEASVKSSLETVLKLLWICVKKYISLHIKNICSCALLAGSTNKLVIYPI